MADANACFGCQKRRSDRRPTVGGSRTEVENEDASDGGC